MHNLKNCQHMVHQTKKKNEKCRNWHCQTYGKCYKKTFRNGLYKSSITLSNIDGNPFSFRNMRISLPLFTSSNAQSKTNTNYHHNVYTNVLVHNPLVRLYSVFSSNSNASFIGRSSSNC